MCSDCSHGFDNLISIWKQLKIDESSQSDESDLIMLLIRVNNEAIFKSWTLFACFYEHSIILLLFFFLHFIFIHDSLHTSASASIMSFHAPHWIHWNFADVELMPASKKLSEIERENNIKYWILQFFLYEINRTIETRFEFLNKLCFIDVVKFKLSNDAGRFKFAYFLCLALTTITLIPDTRYQLNWQWVWIQAKDKILIPHKHTHTHTHTHIYKYISIFNFNETIF